VAIDHLGRATEPGPKVRSWDHGWLMIRSRTALYLIQISALAAVYFATAKLGLQPGLRPR
jgi:hypothetical protein